MGIWGRFADGLPSLRIGSLPEEGCLGSREEVHSVDLVPAQVLCCFLLAGAQIVG